MKWLFIIPGVFVYLWLAVKLGQFLKEGLSPPEIEFKDCPTIVNEDGTEQRRW
jgi:hypothetical protein